MHPVSALQVCSAYPILPSLVSGHGEGKQQQTTAIMFFSQQTCVSAQHRHALQVLHGYFDMMPPNPL